MRVLVALRRPHLRALWISLVLSSIGDMLYAIATVWIAVGQFSCLPAMAGVRLAKLLSRAPSS